jgi:hypothetical protein
LQMKIKKLVTYENIQLETKDGKRPAGTFSRLAKTFLCDNFDMAIVPGVGVSLRPQDADIGGLFVIPFANIPYIVTELDGDQASFQDPHNHTVRRRRRLRSTVESAAPSEGAWLSEGDHQPD